MLADLRDGGYVDLPFVGTHYFLDPTNGSDGNDGQTPDRAFASLPVAYAALTAGQHDTLFYIAGSSSITLVAVLDWAKSYTHFVGIAAPSMLNSRARIFQTGDLNLSPLIIISGSGCVWKNIYVSQEANDTGSTQAVKVTGGRNYFSGCMFAGGGHATAAIDGGTNLLLDDAEENLFENCIIGRDSIVDATGWAALLFDGAARRNTFRNCIFMVYAGATTVYFVEVVDNTGIDRWNLFQDCLFINDCRSYSIGTVFNIPASMASLTNFLIMDGCGVLGADDLDTNARTIVYTKGGANAGGGTSQIMQVSNVT
jgi:hypothetical protein